MKVSTNSQVGMFQMTLFLGSISLGFMCKPQKMIPIPKDPSPVTSLEDICHLTLLVLRRVRQSSLGIVLKSQRILFLGTLAGTVRESVNFLKIPLLS